MSKLAFELNNIFRLKTKKEVKKRLKNIINCFDIYDVEVCEGSDTTGIIAEPNEKGII